MASATGAFKGDARVKHAVLAGLDNPPESGNIWSPFPENPGEITAFCEANGFEPAFLYLGRALVGYAFDEKATDFLKDVLSALPLSADTGALVRNWFIWLWEGREGDALRDMLASSDAQEPARALMALHRRSGDESPSRQDWRQARNAVFAVESLTRGQQGAASIVSASGWDILATPGAASDVVQTCFGVAQQLVDDRGGWTEKADAMRAEIEAAMMRLQPIALAELGDPPADRSDEAVMRPYMARFQEIMTSQRTEAENQAFARMEERGKAVNEAVEIVRRDLRLGLITVVRAANEALAPA